MVGVLLTLRLENQPPLDVVVFCGFGDTLTTLLGAVWTAAGLEKPNDFRVGLLDTDPLDFGAEYDFGEL